ncbi:MBOAT family O-acyltransferase [Paenibacillus anseongense]|uniref:MBOAT family O-acyltransferase n=1 Tax=Paenibacillus anseongense TaxID=2682845 RepID=UPI002DBA2115|nr:MBOAT family O-acyltransferase [Paenibacillus anseongense]MEC0264324.1 MBOAT family O-acyltransferase [Paenibacillus anseongense]
MLFSSPLFLFLFAPIFFTIYFLTIKKHRNLVILLGSLFFYAWGGPSFVGILLLSLLVDWHIVNLMKNSKDGRIKKFYFIIALLINLFLLIYFKYVNFFISNMNDILNLIHIQELTWPNVILPIGISFIVFHKISYIIEIYREEKEPTEKLTDYIIYIMLFPMAIAGPIIKYKDISDQLTKRESSFDDILYGVLRFSIGLFKKVWIADNVAIVANEVFSVPTNEINIVFSWIGVICYSLQIYYDFSGYADMAIGLSRIMGFKVSENFNSPYISQNITEFWRRWHISLSSWMKNYIYIPLGGNRRSKVRNYFNLWSVFLISGLWHGASWTFIVWGILHGLFIVFDKLFWLKFSLKIPKWINILITYVLVLVAWVFFRSSTIESALQYLKKMFDFSTIFQEVPNSLKSLEFSNVIIFIIIFSIIITFLPSFVQYKTGLIKYNHIFGSTFIKMICILVILLLSITKCVTSSFSPFIYFQF